MNEKKRLTIIDGSSLIYSACYNTSVIKEDTDDFSKYREALVYYIDSILSATKADLYVIYGDQPTSYRKNLFKTFKADRAKKPDLKFSRDLLYYANNELNFFSHEELEADDLCLITHREFKDDYSIIIASKDSDLRQYPALFFDYGIYKKEDYKLEEGFEQINQTQAFFNLWKSVLMKGHNNKADYLEGCGKITAENYLKTWDPLQYPYAVLKAFMFGIDKDKRIKRSVKGYGQFKGIDKYSNAFKQTYLLRYLLELEELGIELEFPDFITNSKSEEW